MKRETFQSECACMKSTQIVRITGLELFMYSSVIHIFNFSSKQKKRELKKNIILTAVTRDWTIAQDRSQLYTRC